jgi:hypothetical protein
VPRQNNIAHLQGAPVKSMNWPNRPDIGESKTHHKRAKIIQRWRRICGIAAISRTSRSLMSDGVATWNLEL